MPWMAIMSIGNWRSVGEGEASDDMWRGRRPLKFLGVVGGAIVNFEAGGMLE